MNILLTLNLQTDVSEMSCILYQDRQREQKCGALVVHIVEYVMSGTCSMHRRNKLVYIYSPKT
jgi:hypothetical protein